MNTLIWHLRSSKSSVVDYNFLNRSNNCLRRGGLNFSFLLQESKEGGLPKGSDPTTPSSQADNVSDLITLKFSSVTKIFLHPELFFTVDHAAWALPSVRNLEGTSHFRFFLTWNLFEITLNIVPISDGGVYSNRTRTSSQTNGIGTSSRRS